MLDTGKQQFQKQIRMVGIGCRDDQNNNEGDISSNSEIKTSASQKAGKPQKRKPQKKKKKGKK